MNGATESKFTDPAVRLVRESDIPAIIELFRLNYGDTYPSLEVYDDRWVKRCIYGDTAICIVIEADERVVACGAVILAYGDYNDQIGELARLVVHPGQTRCGMGSRIITALLEAAEEQVEFVIGETRTEHAFSQRRCEEAGFAILGYAPLYHPVNRIREGLILYGTLIGNGRSLRSEEIPCLIPEVAPLARYVLSSMQLPTTLSIVDGCEPYPDEAACTFQPMDRPSLARLTQIKHGRVVEPLLFGAISLEQGYSLIQRSNATYLMAVDKDGRPIGAVGFQEDQENRIVKGIELVAERKELRGCLCRALVDKAEELGADLVEVNVSAYDARLQRTFYEYGFRPAAYAPALVFHGTERLDVVKMIKLNIPYEPGDMKLTEKAKEVLSIVEIGFR